ncbi:MAG: YbaK/EbsC family protein [Actinobacteria bacterium]|jgi:prolyl-tRNA editing enzyme YbaK/EbsC (Cys-tRNA(Pro) deacylase)|nr:YbaK/EbsC family protein [Actinomycetota bacterium]MBU1866777.1 YbaK/EbsC family protein [Actinomycetota bacterium]
MDLPEASQRLAEAARERGLEIQIRLFPEGTRTSADAAAAIGCELSAIAKSLVFVVDDRPVVVIMSGDRRVDPDRLAEAVGGTGGRRAGLDEARRVTGFVAGGTPAFGHATPVEVVIDRSLQRHTEVWSAAGTPTTVYPVRLDDLVAVSGARWVDVGTG